MTRLGLCIFLAAAILLNTVGGAAAQSDFPPCTTQKGALEWWKSQERRLPRGHDTIEDFWRGMTPQFQNDIVRDRAAVCRFLDLVLSALGSSRAPEESAALLVDAAAVAEGLPASIVARPTLMSAARAIGDALESDADAEGVTQARLRMLGAASTLYDAAGLPGGHARVTLRRDAEEAAWRSDLEHVDADVGRAESIIPALRNPVGTALYLATVPHLVTELRSHEAIMRSHGADAPPNDQVGRIAAVRRELVDAHSTGVQGALGITGVGMGTAIGVAVIGRIPLRRMESDVRDLEVSLLGVPL